MVGMKSVKKFLIARGFFFCPRRGVIYKAHFNTNKYYLGQRFRIKILHMTIRSPLE